MTGAPPASSPLPLAAIQACVEAEYGLAGQWSELPSYVDQNLRLETGDGRGFVVKIAHAEESFAQLEFENAALRHVAGLGLCPGLVRTVDGAGLSQLTDDSGRARGVRIVDLLPGTLIASRSAPLDDTLRHAWGDALARLDLLMQDFTHPAMHRELRWDLARAAWIVGHSQALDGHRHQALIDHFVLQFLAAVEPAIPALRRSVIHNDANDHNVLVTDGAQISGIIDFGDMVHSCTVFNLAVAAAYAAFDTPDPVGAIGAIAAGYHATAPLTDIELEILFPAVCMRLCVSLTVSTMEAARQPDNDYVTVTQAAAWRLLEQLHEVTPGTAAERLRAACGTAQPRRRARDVAALRRARDRHLGQSLSLSYHEPLQIVRGRGQYLFDVEGRAFVDGVNNVCHVGHCHPRVIEAATRQMAELNTNTRYLHDNIIAYAERLTALFPDPLNTCYFVCSGSEANELALRMARAHTGRHDVVVLDAAYHGNSSTLIELSPYKHLGPGGRGTPAGVHVAELPDPYRGAHHHGTSEGLAERFANSVRGCLAAAEPRGGAAALFAESISGCGGQVEFPAGYLQQAFAHARSFGAVCVADEVQVGFGRVGTHMWAFESQGVVPDIVTLGKPIGNGHPLAAVVTTPEIAASFANGMEYFNTFGGNPVSCAVGLAVLDVIEDEALVEHARSVGDRMLAGLRGLQERFPILGDVRGRGLFLGVEFVRDRASLEPAAAELSRVVEAMKNAGFLLSSDGPLHNVLKFKPPLPFSHRDAELLLAALDRVLTDVVPR